jgi:hypothetical protein
MGRTKAMENIAENTLTRRQSPRRELHRYINVQCRQSGPCQGPNLATLVVDVSTTGICLMLTEALETGTEVELWIDGYGLGRSIKRVGNVRWHLKDSTGGFRTGIQFQKCIEVRDWINLAATD